MKNKRYKAKHKCPYKAQQKYSRYNENAAIHKDMQ